MIQAIHRAVHVLNYLSGKETSSKASNASDRQDEKQTIWQGPTSRVVHADAAPPPELLKTRALAAGATRALDTCKGHGEADTDSNIGGAN